MKRVLPSGSKRDQRIMHGGSNSTVALMSLALPFSPVRALSLEAPSLAVSLSTPSTLATICRPGITLESAPQEALQTEGPAALRRGVNGVCCLALPLQALPGPMKGSFCTCICKGSRKIASWQLTEGGSAGSPCRQSSQARCAHPWGGPGRLQSCRSWASGGRTAAGRDRDRAVGHTTVGPHRADWRVVLDIAPNREPLSRGQGKLLALCCQTHGYARTFTCTWLSQTMDSLVGQTRKKARFFKLALHVETYFEVVSEVECVAANVGDGGVNTFLWDIEPQSDVSFMRGGIYKQRDVSLRNVHSKRVARLLVRH